MSKPISYFSAYKQKENRITNYCGLLMKMVYEESPLQFEQLLSTLVTDTQDLAIGPKFAQQQKMRDGIPDLSITQRPFQILFETKNTDWFYDDQLKRHLESFDQIDQTRVLVLLSNFETNNYAERFENAYKIAAKEGIILQVLSFEDYIAAFDELDLSQSLIAAIDEFKIFLDSLNLLPNWKYMLDVVNAATMQYEIEAGSYMCPDTKGSYSHRRAKWLGMYGNKTVSKIFHIDAVVALNQNDVEIRWNNSEQEEEVLKTRAKEQIKLYDYRKAQVSTHGVQVFLLSKGADTDFIKSTPGGLRGPKTYFHDIAKADDTTVKLAERLRGRSWRDFK